MTYFCQVSINKQPLAMQRRICISSIWGSGYGRTVSNEDEGWTSPACRSSQPGTDAKVLETNSPETHILKCAGNDPTMSYILETRISLFQGDGEEKSRGRVGAFSKQRQECLSSWERTSTLFFPSWAFYEGERYLYNSPKAGQHLHQPVVTARGEE